MAKQPDAWRFFSSAMQEVHETLTGRWWGYLLALTILGLGIVLGTLLGPIIDSAPAGAVGGGIAAGVILVLGFGTAATRVFARHEHQIESLTKPAARNESGGRLFIACECRKRDFVVMVTAVDGEARYVRTLLKELNAPERVFRIRPWAENLLAGESTEWHRAAEYEAQESGDLVVYHAIERTVGGLDITTRRASIGRFEIQVTAEMAGQEKTERKRVRLLERDGFLECHDLD